MAKAKRTHDWRRTADILQMLHNSRCTEKNQLLHTSDTFMPPDLVKQKKRWRPPPATEAECAMLRKVFPGGKGKKR